MMPNDDLILRREALDAICECFNIMEAQGICMATARGIVKSVLDNAPAVDAAPVVHGTWGRYYDEDHCTEYIVCSNCGAEYDSDIVFAYHNGESRLELEGLENCPHCGARMDGGEES